MNKIFVILALIAALVLGALYLMKGKSPADGSKDGQAAGTQAIKLYYYNPERDHDADGNILCGANGLMVVEREIAPTQTPLKESIELLLEGALTPEEKASGITTEFPLEGVALKSASITDGTATLTFDDPQRKTSGGSCRVSVLAAQIIATAKQFPTVQDVRLLPEELFQP